MFENTAQSTEIERNFRDHLFYLFLERDVNMAFENGANGYLKKPTSFGVFKDLIKKAILARFSAQSGELSKAEFFLK
ncbi:response regulator [Costertonia aggregata]|uniref:Response regulatory domain-containing protein n=1 Tax=Costertonia aggregata TaxID=343403 RepID=A0A7H9ASW2_9FLAO|nr:hypothetical protein [Costertonia aggregata]QLG46544.1 hypothetical protein HYG79_14705 [Costertonia aggregata]